MRTIRTAGLSIAFVAFAALLSACQPAEPASTGSGAAPATSAATTTASPTPTVDVKANTKEVCTSVTKVMIDGSVKIADDSVKSIDESWSQSKRNKNLQTTFASMGKKIAAEADKAVDPELKKTIEDTGAKVAAGAKKSDALAFLKKDFQTAAKSIDKTCGN
ncbi:hypothetical protein [Actinoplanes friuliensis]|uniref:Uncharacterized protein n=1 Tax=Actinoplanes friuliensis DSM 7358 TaxID=1246995 RepID=U5VZE8_9ACTN|nr:hypothetical protein [Actinoplanes friuliensis]AGZ42259.1 hypothetical protein AFR_19935 [Actinoplanes friuliensis DSM 7358]